MWNIKNRISDEIFIQICENAVSMADAAEKLGLHFNSFKKRALELKCYKPNQSGKGLKKSKTTKISTDDILLGKYPSYQTYKLKIRLIEDGILEYKCQECGIVEWNNKNINLELDHIDGNKYNHTLSNLRLLCPNCHSQTETYKSKNKKLSAFKET